MARIERCRKKAAPARISRPRTTAKASGARCPRSICRRAKRDGNCCPSWESHRRNGLRRQWQRAFRPSLLLTRAIDAQCRFRSRFQPGWTDLPPRSGRIRHMCRLRSVPARSTEAIWRAVWTQPFARLLSGNDSFRFRAARQRPTPERKNHPLDLYPAPRNIPSIRVTSR
jgi:hypothetical protein